MSRWGSRRRRGYKSGEDDRVEWIQLLIELFMWAPKLIFGIFRLILKLFN